MRKQIYNADIASVRIFNEHFDLFLANGIGDGTYTVSVAGYSDVDTYDWEYGGNFILNQEAWISRYDCEQIKATRLEPGAYSWHWRRGEGDIVIKEMPQGWMREEIRLAD